MVKIKYTKHAKDKFELLKSHGFEITPEQVEETVANPDKVIQQPKERLIAQKRITDNHILRVIFREENKTYVVITFYPGRRKRYETEL